MIVGCLGGITFAVFDGYVKTIKDMVQSVSARYTTHQPIITRRCRLSSATKSSAAIGGSSNP